MKLHISNSFSPLMRQLLHHTWLQIMPRVATWNDVTIGPEGERADVIVSNALVEAVGSGNLTHQAVFQGDQPLLYRSDGKPDYFGTIVYLANYLQEYGAAGEDELGRFPYALSLQFRYGCVRQDLVSSYASQLAQDLGRPAKERSPSRVFVSHDNDGLFRGFLQDGLYALKKGRLDWVLRLLLERVAMKHRWMNMSHIMDINEKYGIKSTFFWLVNRGDVRVGDRALRNADYSITDPRIRRLIKDIERRGFEQGIHKSISDQDFSEELARLPFSCIANRNHFLKLSVPDHFKAVDEAGLKLDFSLGFAEHYGFRNSYALPFRPFDLKRGCVCSALYVPLAIMDTSNWSYMKLPLDEMKQQLEAFVSEHAESAVISILWHNKYFTEMKFKGYLTVYESLLNLCAQKAVHSVTQQELLTAYPKSESWE
jgi:hypothetical protein